MIRANSRWHDTHDHISFGDKSKNGRVWIVGLPSGGVYVTRQTKQNEYGGRDIAAVFIALAAYGEGSVLRLIGAERLVTS